MIVEMNESLGTVALCYSFVEPRIQWQYMLQEIILGGLNMCILNMCHTSRDHVLVDVARQHYPE